MYGWTFEWSNSNTPSEVNSAGKNQRKRRDKNLPPSIPKLCKTRRFCLQFNTQSEINSGCKNERKRRNKNSTPKLCKRFCLYYN